MESDLIEIMSIKHKQKVLLHLFKQFHDICDENDLVYNAFGGTMLGAIRHNGFIPWDDDIDVTMPRGDYNKLIEIIRSGKYGNLTIHSYPDDNYIYPYAKLGLKETVQYEKMVKKPYNKLTINMDIFPVDGYPCDETEIDRYNSYESNIILCTYIIESKYNCFHIKSLFKRKYSQIIGYKQFVKKQIELASRNPIDRYDNLICHGAGWGRKGKINKKIYFDRKLYKFEDISVWGIKDYHAHLKKLYGDYMQLPPLEKRVSPHDNEVYIDKRLFNKIINEQEED